MNIKAFLKKNILLNRTIVSEDSTSFVLNLQKEYNCTILEYDTGKEYATWLIPLEWNLKKAILKKDGKTIASYDQSPLFIAPYSQSFSGVITKEELVKHTMVNPKSPDCFGYEFRLAYDFKRRLNEWRITLPQSLLESLSHGDYYIDIDAETKPGSLKIAEYKIEGIQKECFAFLSHYCHPAQINDGIVGTVIMFEVINRIKEKYSQTKYSYLALAMPETIGSSVYITDNENSISDFIGTVFCEMGGANSPLQMVFSRRGNTYIDRIFEYLVDHYDKEGVRKVAFRKGWGNDELVFDSPGVGVPSVSIDRFPFEYYHTNLDNLNHFNEDKAEETIALLLDAVEILEEDYIPKAANKVPIYLTRFNLYSDWTHNRIQYDQNIILLDAIWEGISVFDISVKYNIEYNIVKLFYDKLISLKLIEKLPIDSFYTKQTKI
jgi:aminopeptidase-like protein